MRNSEYFLWKVIPLNRRHFEIYDPLDMIPIKKKILEKIY